jgi:hypothetical protein
MIISFFKQLSNVTGLPLIVSMGTLVILFSLTLFGVYILMRIRSIKKVLNNLNDRLDTISHRLGWQPGELENIQPHRYKLGSNLKNGIATDGRTSLETKNTADIAQKNGSEKHRLNTEISTKIYELLKNSDQPTPYHDLTQHLLKDYPGYNYDFFLKELEDLQKEGKVEVQLIAGKLYIQIKKI